MSNNKSKGPWTVRERHTEAQVVDALGQVVAHCNWTESLHGAANARHIVDCVNALEGLNPAAIKDLIHAAKLALGVVKFDGENLLSDAVRRLHMRGN